MAFAIWDLDRYGLARRLGFSWSEKVYEVKGLKLCLGISGRLRALGLNDFRLRGSSLQAILGSCSGISLKLP